MHALIRRRSQFNKGRQELGVSLIELLVSLAIISILATVALPYAKHAITREKEYELRDALRTVRLAIDRFHDDWRITKGGGGFRDAASQDGYPKSLSVLIDGVETADAVSKRRRYLRGIPRNPFAPSATELEDEWQLLSYQDDPDTTIWGGQDVYDIRAKSKSVALDGSRYETW